MKQSPSKAITAHIPLPLADKINRLASCLVRSRSWIVKQALSAWVEQEEERYQLTLEALADVGAGNLVNHDTVRTWADSLTTDSPLPVPIPVTR